ncbi:ureidoglycolate lyase [Kordiimonas sp.]|uniref:ureidoglycolate lyase n=1 Tax=Kordiimonas sp. TaxID=1970157 RepID=UPI003A8E52FC
MRVLTAEPLTADVFKPFGDVIEATDRVRQFGINYGNTVRFHDLAHVDVDANRGRAGMSIFRSTPLPLPVLIELMEYHPLSSQAFMPLGPKPYLVVVAPKGDFDAAQIRAFKAEPGQGVNYHAGTWHHFCLALEGVSDFLVVDRIGDGDNCVEHHLDEAEKLSVSI